MSPSATSGHASVSRAGETHIPLVPAGLHHPPKFGCRMGWEGISKTEPKGMKGREGMEGIEGTGSDGKGREVSRRNQKE